MIKLQSLVTDNKEINDAYRLAIANVAANILPFKDGILEKEEKVFIRCFFNKFFIVFDN